MNDRTLVLKPADVVSVLIAAARWGECSISMLWVVGRGGRLVGLDGDDGVGREGNRREESLKN